MEGAYVNSNNDPALAGFKEDREIGAVRPNVDFYVYSVTNAEAVVAGEKPVMESIGPFEYVQESTGREGASVNDGFTTYSTKKKYTPRGSAAELEKMLQKEVVVPNAFFEDVKAMPLPADIATEYGTSAAAPLFMKLTAGQILGAASSAKMEPLLQREVSFRDFGGLGAEEQEVKMKTGQRFKSKGFRYVVQDSVKQYCTFDADCMPEDASLATADDCNADGKCQPMMVEGYELRSSAPAALFSNQGSANVDRDTFERLQVCSRFRSRHVQLPGYGSSFAEVVDDSETHDGTESMKWLDFDSACLQHF